jgi:hypothetical protein
VLKEEEEGKKLKRDCACERHEEEGKHEETLFSIWGSKNRPKPYYKRTLP